MCHVSYVHNVAGVSNATSYGNDGISTFSEDDATVARRGNGNDETTTFSTTTMQQRHDGTAEVSSLAAMAGGSSNNCGDGGSSSRGESFSSYSSVQTASKAPAKQSTTSTTTSSPKRTNRSDGPGVPADRQCNVPRAPPLHHHSNAPLRNTVPVHTSFESSQPSEYTPAVDQRGDSELSTPQKTAVINCKCHTNSDCCTFVVHLVVSKSFH